MTNYTKKIIVAGDGCSSSGLRRKKNYTEMSTTYKKVKPCMNKELWNQMSQQERNQYRNMQKHSMRLLVCALKNMQHNDGTQPMTTQELLEEVRANPRMYNPSKKKINRYKQDSRFCEILFTVVCLSLTTFGIVYLSGMFSGLASMSISFKGSWLYKQIFGSTNDTLKNSQQPPLTTKPKLDNNTQLGPQNAYNFNSNDQYFNTMVGGRRRAIKLPKPSKSKFIESNRYVQTRRGLEYQKFNLDEVKWQTKQVFKNIKDEVQARSNKFPIVSWTFNKTTVVPEEIDTSEFLGNTYKTTLYGFIALALISPVMQLIKKVGNIIVYLFSWLVEKLGWVARNLGFCNMFSWRSPTPTDEYLQMYKNTLGSNYVYTPQPQEQLYV